MAASRNFHGTLRVRDRVPERPLERHWELLHGSTTHGAQFHAEERSRWPTVYFGPSSGIGVTLNSLKTAPRRNVGLVGLGAGTLASYGRRGERFTFYEINPAMVELARSPFTLLRNSAAQIEIVPGDARLALEARIERGEHEGFDVLVLDAFSGDAIPAHLLTVEAMEVYLARMKSDGIIAAHVSNRYPDFRGVLVGLSQHFQMDFVIVDDVPRTEDYWVSPSQWCLLTSDKKLFRAWMPSSPEARAALEAQYDPVLWTDDHASLLRVLR